MIGGKISSLTIQVIRHQSQVCAILFKFRKRYGKVNVFEISTLIRNFNILTLVHMVELSI